MFLARKINLVATLVAVTIYPAMEKIHSVAAEVAGIQW